MKINMKKGLLFSALLASGILLACGNAGNKGTATTAGTDQNKPVVEHINQETAMPMLNDSSIVMIDVRTPGEVQAGYIDGADMFIDFNGDFQGGIANLDKNKTYLVYCQSGGRSSRAAKVMEAAGFAHVYNLQGGIGAWSGPVKR